MRASKAMSVSLRPQSAPSPWRIEALNRLPSLRGFSLRSLFGRKPPSLFQRCLAVHIAHASEQKTLR